MEIRVWDGYERTWDTPAGEAPCQWPSAGSGIAPPCEPNTRLSMATRRGFLFSIAHFSDVAARRHFWVFTSSLTSGAGTGNLLPGMCERYCWIRAPWHVLTSSPALWRRWLKSTLAVLSITRLQFTSS